jgi:hypothetical protein
MVVAVGRRLALALLMLVPSIDAARADVQRADVAAEGLARVIVEGIHVGPAKRGGAKWDGSGRLSSEDIKALTSAGKDLAKYTLDPSTIVLANVVDTVAEIGLRSAKGDDPPDPRGTAVLYVKGKQIGASISLPIVRNTFAPHWPEGIEWRHVPIGDDVRIRVVLFDSDDARKPQGDDQIGTVVVNSVDLRRAAADGRVFLVYVGDQTDNQVVAVKLTVMIEGDAASAEQTVTGAEATFVSDADTERFVAFFDQFVDTVVAAKQDCRKLTNNVNVLIDQNAELLSTIRSAKKAKKNLPQRAKDRMMSRVKEMMPAMQKCQADPGFAAAMKRMESN